MMSCAACVRSRTLPTRGQPLERALQAPLGHAQLELPLEPEEICDETT